ncbi:hypothetical protein BTO00_22625, partial [Vibrio campbellii]|uniref:DUF4347 domain-containing protein n=1 Tax=Vibrio campbellii TaxID=680 RepID=UPI000D4F26BE
MYKVTRLLLNGFIVFALVALSFVYASLVVVAPSTDRVVYIFDSAVEDIEHLSQTITQPTYILSSTEPVLVQLADIAKVHPSAQQWHIVSHGRPGELQLGSERWDMNWLEQASLSPFRALFPKGSQWYLYACDLAQGEQGKAFVDALADALDVPIAASINKTGVIAGADTELEYQASPQSHDSDALISYLNFTDYPHTLTLADLENYAQSGGSGTRPSDTTYSNALINNIDPLNVDDYNRELVNQNATLDFTTTTDIQALVNAINELDDYVTDPN